MPTIGLITEYNPFHHGHARQLLDIKEKFGKAALTVAVMSGNFTQRGEPALLDKWTRAESALAAGVNLVLELPTLFAVGAAPDFATGAVSLLAATGLDLTICCGIESDCPDELRDFARLAAKEPEGLSLALKACLKEGLNPAAAWSKAWQIYCRQVKKTWPADLFFGSNNRLAMEYIKAADRLERPLPVQLLRRRGASYLSHSLTGENMEIAGWAGLGKLNSEESPLPSLWRASNTNRQASLASGSETDQSTPLASATAIRATLKAGHQKKALPPTRLWDYLPASTGGQILADLTGPGTGWADSLARAGQVVYSRLLGLTPTDLLTYDGFSVGLAGRLTKVAAGLDGNSPDSLWNELVRRTRCKSFTEAMTGRALTALLLSIRKTDRESARRTGPLYLRPLACDRRGRRLLRQIQQTASLPIITKDSDFLEHGQAGPDFRLQYETDLRAARIYKLLRDLPPTADFDRNTIIG